VFKVLLSLGCDCQYLVKVARGKYPLDVLLPIFQEAGKLNALRKLIMETVFANDANCNLNQWLKTAVIDNEVDSETIIIEAFFEAYSEPTNLGQLFDMLWAKRKAFFVENCVREEAESK